ncbi:MAG: F0F1 ATP synthase subunit B family protein, partial [Sulfuriferula sp.]
MMDINVTLIAQMTAFALLVWFVHRVLMNPMVAMLSQRRKQIADGLAAGERGKHELELASKRAVENLHEAKQKAAEIIA